MKKSIISLLFFFAVCTFTPNIVFAQSSPDYNIIMCIDAESLDFGNVFVGTTKSLTFSIQLKNYRPSDNPLIFSLSSINQPFSIIGPVGIIKLYMPLTFKTFTVMFKPTALISYNQTITLSNNATIIEGSGYTFVDQKNQAIIPASFPNGNPQLSIHIIGTGVKETIIQPKTPGPAKKMQYETGKY